jgi:hypothetical protein
MRVRKVVNSSWRQRWVEMGPSRSEIEASDNKAKAPEVEMRPSGVADSSDEEPDSQCEICFQAHEGEAWYHLDCGHFYHRVSIRRTLKNALEKRVRSEARGDEPFPVACPKCKQGALRHADILAQEMSESEDEQPGQENEGQDKEKDNDDPGAEDVEIPPHAKDCGELEMPNQDQVGGGAPEQVVPEEREEKEKGDDVPVAGEAETRANDKDRGEAEMPSQDQVGGGASEQVVPEEREEKVKGDDVPVAGEAETRANDKDRGEAEMPSQDQVGGGAPKQEMPVENVIENAASAGRGVPDNTWKVGDIKVELKKHGLSQNGNKAVLLGRLLIHLEVGAAPAIAKRKRADKTGGRQKNAEYLKQFTWAHEHMERVEGPDQRAELMLQITLLKKIVCKWSDGDERKEEGEAKLARMREKLQENIAREGRKRKVFQALDEAVVQTAAQARM